MDQAPFRVLAYSGASLLLLDDPLSAVDPAVAATIVKECVCGFMADDECFPFPLEERRQEEAKTPPATSRARTARVLVTHQTQFLPFADRVAVLGPSGDLVALGSFDELVAQGIDLGQLVRQGDDEPPQSPSSRAKAASSASNSGLWLLFKRLPDREIPRPTVTPLRP